MCPVCFRLFLALTSMSKRLTYVPGGPMWWLGFFSHVDGGCDATLLAVLPLEELSLVFLAWKDWSDLFSSGTQLATFCPCGNMHNSCCYTALNSVHTASGINGAPSHLFVRQILVLLFSVPFLRLGNRSCLKGQPAVHTAVCSIPHVVSSTVTVIISCWK